MSDSLLIGLFSFLSVISGIGLINSRNPVHSILHLIVIFVNATLLLIMLGTEFLAWIYLIVYVGAVMILFLFVIMMIDIKEEEVNEDKIRYYPIGA